MAACAGYSLQLLVGCDGWHWVVPDVTGAFDVLATGFGPGCFEQEPSGPHSLASLDDLGLVPQGSVRQDSLSTPIFSPP